MILKRVGPLSVGKVLGGLYAVLGLFIGAIFALLCVLGATFGGREGLPALAGVSAIVIAPIVYGTLGFIGGIIGAALYNVAAGLFGGIELEFENPKPEAYGGTTQAA
jgi:hypothetical protein